jgi:hypothetical protein
LLGIRGVFEKGKHVALAATAPSSSNALTPTTIVALQKAWLLLCIEPNLKFKKTVNIARETAK